MFRKILRNTTDRFHKLHYITCLSVALIKREELNFYHQWNVIRADIPLRYFLRILFCFTRYSSSTDYYTQAVWADTYTVGCGYTEFSISDGIHDKFFVCNYGPSGNYEGGSMYTVGAACTRCPTTAFYFYNGLCLWGSYVVFNAVTGFRPVGWAPACHLSVASYKIPLILQTRKI